MATFDFQLMLTWDATGQVSDLSPTYVHQHIRLHGSDRNSGIATQLRHLALPILPHLLIHSELEYHNLILRHFIRPMWWILKKQYLAFIIMKLTHTNRKRNLAWNFFEWNSCNNLSYLAWKMGRHDKLKHDTKELMVEPYEAGNSQVRF